MIKIILLKTKGGGKVISIRDLAKLAEVSPATVSRVLNNDPTISVADETRERIITLAKEMNYTTKNRKHSAKTTTLEMSIGLIIRHNVMSEQSDPYFKNIRSGIEATAKKWRIKIDLLFRVRDQNKNWDLISEYGVIIIIGRMSNSFYEKVYSLNQKIIVLDNPFCPKYLFSINNDFYDQTQEILDLLIQNGHQRITYIGGYHSIVDENGQSVQSKLDTRLSSFEQYRDTHHLKNHLNYYLDQWTSQSGYQIVKQMIDTLPSLPTAIIAGSDPIAIGVYHALKSEGYKIPEDVSIISFDDIGLTKYLTPSLSSIYLDTTEMGKITLNLAKAIITKEFSTPIRITCTSQINIRDSIKFIKDEKKQ